jgi:hypothetical protein
MAGFEPLDIVKYVENTLTADTVLQGLFGGTVALYFNVSVRQPPPFYVVFTMPSSHDVNAVGGYRVMEPTMVHIEAVGREIGYDVLRPIMERIEQLLSTANAQVGSTWIGRFIRTNVIPRPTDVFDGKKWFYLAGLYETVSFTV